MTFPTKAKLFLILLLILVLSFSLFSCRESSQAKIKVRTGTRTVCKYGEVLQDDTRFVTIPKAEASKYKVRTIRKLCLEHRRAEDLYKQAERALEEGERDRAQETFKKVMEIDPKFKDTKKRLASLNETIVKQEAASSPTSGVSPGEPTQTTPVPPVSGSASTTTQGPEALPGTTQSGEGTPSVSSGDGTSEETATSTPSIDLVLLVPGSLSGYKTGILSKSDTYASRDYTPQSKKQQLVEFLLITVHKLNSADEARTFIERVSRKAFYANGQDVNLRTGRTAYYGTDETHYANVSWHEGNLVYEVQMMSATGSPNDLYNEIVEVAKQVP